MSASTTSSQTTPHGVGDHSCITAAIVQAEVAPDVASALQVTEERVRDARAAGASLVVFPETWIPGYPMWLDLCRDAGLWNHPPAKAVFGRMARNSVSVPGATTDALASIARDSSVTLVVGVSERVERGMGHGTLYNTLLTFAPDGMLLNHHRKLVPTYTERLVWGDGDVEGLRAVDTPAGRIGGLICWEHWMPLARQALHESREDVHVAVWPTVDEMHQVASRQYAFEGRCFVLAAGALMRASALPPELEPHPDRVTSPEQWILSGGSAIIGPDGRYVTEPVYDEPAVIIAELPLARIREESMTLDVTGHYHRAELFDFAPRRRGHRAAGSGE
ncbi:MAG TPA: carbon-nitrogen hydrolase family protein [Gemmatimonadaceae bacterium]|nr:carbon-nitrogen hydrolase family protein [Gemmatimonadaceae bacterium]